MSAKPTVPRRGLIAGGTWRIARIKAIDAYPEPGRHATIRGEVESLDGAPHNLLVGLARAGAPFPLAGAGFVGRDAQGARLLSECRQRRIDTKGLQITAQAATAYTDVLIEAESGRRTCFHFSGANALWGGEGLDFDKSKARHFHLGSLLRLEALDATDSKFGTRAARLLAAAQTAGLKTSLDFVPEPGDRLKTLVPPTLKFADYLMLSELAAAHLTGFKTRRTDGQLDTVALRHAAGALLQLGVRELVILHFPEGGFARTRKGEDLWQPAVKLPAKAMANTLGAGDAFRAGVLWGLHEGWDLPRSLRSAVCLAAACLSDSSTTDGIKTLSSCLALGKKYGFRPSLETVE